MSNLRETIEQEAVKFTQNILAALRGASLDELAGITNDASRAAPRAPAARSSKSNGVSAAPRKPGRLGRRTAADIARAVEQIVALVAKHPEGLRAEQIKEQLGFDKREMPSPMNEALALGAITKTGQKRATTYFAGSGGGAAPAKRGVKKKAAAKK